jgi:SEC-C motif-containing protein
MPFAGCCGRFLAGEAHAPTPEALMRSRYTAFARRDIDYLVATHDHPQPERLRQELRSNIGQQHWLKLSVEQVEDGAADTGYVTFCATFVEAGRMGKFRERSEFHRRSGRWYYAGQT